MNIKKMLDDLKKHGLTDQEIGNRTGMSQPIITRLRNGGQRSTSFEKGKKIEALHMEIARSDADTAN